MTTDRITRINRALRRIGADPLDSEDDARADTYLDIHDGVLERIATFPFSFMKLTRQLVRLVDTPVHGWTYGFQLPADRIGAPRAVYPNATDRKPTTNYDILGDTLVTDHETIWLTFMTLASYGRWPGDVRELVTKAMMAEFALSIREDRTLRDRLYQDVWGTPAEEGRGGMLAAALDNDNQALPSVEIAGGISPLLDVR